MPAKSTTPAVGERLLSTAALRARLGVAKSQFHSRYRSLFASALVRLPGSARPRYREAAVNRLIAQFYKQTQRAARPRRAA